MSDIQFESDNLNFTRSSAGGSGGGSNRKGMSGWLLAHGLARSENIAQIILLCIVGFNFLVAVILLKYFGVI